MKKTLAAVCMALILAVQTAFGIRAGAFSYEGELSAAFSYTEELRGGAAPEFGRSDRTEICRARLYGADAQYAEYTASVKRAAEEMLRSEGFVKPTDIQRAAIALSVAGECTAELIDAAAYSNENFSRQGLNAWIWGLIAANCSGVEAGENALYSRKDLAREIISAQLSDGGFALSGTGADADMTAAAIYALSPLSEDEEISAAADRAVERLIALQLPSGGFASIGNENCESTAQAIIAFTAAGLSADNEAVSRAVSAMLSYRRENGGFAHLPDGETNALATVQAVEALTALALSERGERLYDRKSVGETAEASPENPTAPEIIGEAVPEKTAEAAPENPAETAQKTALGGTQIKLILSASLAAAFLALLIWDILKRSKTKLFAAAILAALSGGVWLLDIKSTEEYYAQTAQDTAFTVTISVSCREAAANIGLIDESVNPLSAVPEDGVIIAERELGLPEGATAFDALICAAREERVRVDYGGTAYGAYIRGIGGISEFGFGSMSGWLYFVNGEKPDRSAGAYELSEGDIVEFKYTCDYQNDPN